MAAKQEKRKLAERQDLERRDAEIVDWRAVDHAQCTWKGDHTLQNFAQNLYCLKNSPLGDASIHCKHSTTGRCFSAYYVLPN